MKQLFDTKPDLRGTVICILLLACGYMGLIRGLPFSFLYLAIAGCTGAFLIWGMEGLKNLFYPIGKKSVKYIIIGYLWNALQSFALAYLIAIVLHFKVAPNPATGIFKDNSLLGFLKNIAVISFSLLGEELIILVILCVAVYFLKQKGLRNHSSMILMTILSAIVFGLMHYETYRGNYIQLVIIGMARLPFNWTAYKANSITASTISHIVFDVSTFLFTSL